MGLSVLGVAGQGQPVDSLLDVLHTQQLSPDKQLTLYKELCRAYLYNDFEKIVPYAESGLRLALKEKDKAMASVFTEYLGRVNNSRAKHDTARVYYDKALAFAIDAEDKNQEATVYQSIAISYDQQGKNATAIEYYLKALAIYEQSGNQKSQTRVLSNIGGLHRKLNDDVRALYYLEQAEGMAEALGDTEAELKISHDLGLIYLNKEDYDKALAYELKVADLSRASDNLFFEIGSMQALTIIYFVGLKDFEKAEDYAQKGLLLAEDFGNPRLLVAALSVLSDIYRAQERYPECEAAASQAWATDSSHLDIAGELAYNLAYANIYLGNKDKAAHFLSAYETLSQEVTNEGFHDALAGMEVKYETEQKELRITVLEKERQLYTYLGLAAVLLAVALGIALRQKVTSGRREKQLIATHAVLDGEMGERARLARDLHDRLSGHLSAVKLELNSNRESLQQVNDKLDACIEEVRSVAHNLMPVSLQYGMKVALEGFAAQFPTVHFHFFGAEKRVEPRTEFVIYCCASELVNNSLRHSAAQSINLQLIQDAKHISLTVQDDGRGYDPSATAGGFGLKNIRDRVASCNGKIDVATSPGKGVETTIELQTATL